MSLFTDRNILIVVLLFIALWYFKQPYVDMKPETKQPNENQTRELFSRGKRSRPMNKGIMTQLGMNIPNNPMNMMSAKIKQNLE